MIRYKKRWHLKKIIIIFFCIVLSALAAVYFTKKIFYSGKNPDDPWIAARVEDGSLKYISKETLIKDMAAKKQLITMELSLEEALTLNDSWGQYDIFKKLQTIHFYGHGIYCIDLALLNDDTVITDSASKSITLKVPEPIVKDVVLDEDKTIYESPDMGILRFGDVALTSAQYSSVVSHVKSRMREKLMEDENLKNAEDESTACLKALVQSICRIDSQNINIEYY